jgi:hypothetical protein
VAGAVGVADGEADGVADACGFEVTATVLPLKAT